MKRYEFTITISGLGNCTENAWADAVEHFTLDPGIVDPAIDKVEIFEIDED